MSDNMMKEKLDSVFGIEPIEAKEVEVIPSPKQEIVEAPELTPDAEQDYAFARNTFRSLIAKGNSAMENLTDLAKESESPRAYEVLSTMMKTIADTTKDLYDLQKKTKDLKKDDAKRPQDNPNINVEKAVFVGTTAELLQRMKEEKKNENS